MPGEITTALDAGDREKVVALAANRFQRLWASIADKLLPANRRRSEDENDVVQETLLQLNRYLENGNTFGDSGDIYRWSSVVASNKAMQARDRNRRYEGPSTLASGNSSDQTSDPNSALELAASKAETSDSTRPADSVVIGRETLDAVTSMAKELNSQITQLLNESTLDEQEVLQWYFKGMGARATAKQLSSDGGVRITEYYVRNVTFLFKESIALQDRVTVLRSQIMSLEVQPNEIVPLLESYLPIVRILTDFRDKP